MDPSSGISSAWSQPRVHSEGFCDSSYDGNSSGESHASPSDCNFDTYPDLSSSASVLDPVKLMSAICHSFLSSKTALGQFTRDCLKPVSACTVQGESHSSIWPVPPPRWRWSACKHLGVRRRKRKRFLETRARLLQLLVSSLNWETLGHPCRAPARACIGFSIGAQQHLVLERLETKLTHFLRAAQFFPDDLGRANDKFQGVIKRMQELPRCKLGLQDLELMIQRVHTDMFKQSQDSGKIGETHDFGGSPAEPCYEGRSRASSNNHGQPSHQCVFERVADCNAHDFGSRPVTADRVKWKHPPTFDPTPFLENSLLRAAYKDPETLRKPREQWPKSSPGKVHCSKDELVRLATKWDELGACRIFDASEKDWHEAVGLFCVPKDSEFDRLIINPKTINSRMHTISDSTKTLAPGCMLGLLHLRLGEVFRICADDLTDFYYTFKISRERALRNCLRMRFRPDEIRHLQCFEPRHEKSSSLLIALNTLAMGDSLAVEIAQAAHTAVLKQLCGAMVVHETLRYRFPVPRGDFVEMLAIDDHVTVQRLPKQDYPSNPRLRDTQVFEASEKAYVQVGLIQQEKKRKRNCLQAVVLGCEFDGEEGVASAPRCRLAILATLTMQLVQIGTCTRNLLSTLLGCWIHVLLFRRALFSVLDSVFREGLDRPKHEVFCLSNQSRNELQMIAILAPMAHSDLRVHYSPYLYTTDASPWGGAVCKAEVGSKVTEELWRHSEQKGFYTRLESPVSAILSEKGIDHCSNLFGEEPPKLLVSSIPNSLSEGILYDALELFRGSGNWSNAHSAMGLSVHDGVDTDGRRIRSMDLTDMGVFRELVALALRRVVKEWHAGVPCLSFGTLRRPRVRSKTQPFGFDPEDPFTRLHNCIAQRTGIILVLAILGGSYISVEQPGSSCLFHMHVYTVLIRLGCIITRFCFCHFGSAFMKPSKWLHNKPWLESLSCKCQCPHRGSHFVVQGTFTHENIENFKSRCRPSCQAVYGCEPTVGQAVSSFSAAYPLELVTRMASGAAAAKRGEVGKLSAESRVKTISELGIQLEMLDSSWLQGESPYPTRKWHEDPDWVSEICDSLKFRECFRYKFKKSGHINVNEARTYKSWIKSLSKSSPNTRCVGLLDSRVTIGAAAKGRSSSFAISRVLQGSLAYILGGNLYPGCIHCRSQDNRADEPSRGSDVREPTKEVPLWLTDLQLGKYDRFDKVVAANRVPKLAARWLRLLLLLGGDIEPNPGPSCVFGRRERGPMDLSTGFAPATADRMKKCLNAFFAWLTTEFPRSALSLMSSAETAAFALRAYGLHCFQSGLPRYLYVYAITAVVDKYPHYRHQMTPAWQIDKKWQQHEPGECRAVLPATAIRASICIAALWGWFQWLGSVLIGFSAMLHPTEMISLRRKDLILPRDTAYDSDSLFVHVRDPKTARFARRQHGRIDDANIIAVVDCLFAELPLNERLFSGTMSMFRRQWNAIMKQLSIPHSQLQRGATPAVLRGSGATYLYQTSEDLQWVAWRGRWARNRTLEFYLQEVSAQLLVHELSAPARQRLFELDRCSWAVLCSVLSLRSSTE